MDCRAAGACSLVVMQFKGERGAIAGRVLGGVGAAVSCVPMVAMVPGGVASVFGLVGLGAGSGAVVALSPGLSMVERPLLLVSTALLAVSGLRCGRAAVLSAVAGGILLYLSMYVLTAADGTASPGLFYAGLALFLSTYVISWARRRRRRCRPLVDPRVAKRLLAGTVVTGTVAVVVAASAGTASTAAQGRAVSGSGHSAGRSSGAMPGMAGGAQVGSMSGRSH